MSCYRSPHPRNDPRPLGPQASAELLSQLWRRHWLCFLRHPGGVRKAKNHTGPVFLSALPGESPVPQLLAPFDSPGSVQRRAPEPSRCLALPWALRSVRSRQRFPSAPGTRTKLSGVDGDSVHGPVLVPSPGHRRPLPGAERPRRARDVGRAAGCCFPAAVSPQRFLEQPLLDWSWT